MNQSAVTVVCVFLSAALSTVGASYQIEKANSMKDKLAVTTITTEFSGVKAAVHNFSNQLNALSTDTAVLKNRADQFDEFRVDIDMRVRELERKVRP